MKLKNLIKVTAIVPNVFIADPIKNSEEIIENIKKSELSNIYVTPELSLTGYTCGDLFNNRQLYLDLEVAISNILNFSKTMTNSIIVVGAPIRKDNKLFNCALYITNGYIIGIVPKVYIPNYNEFYEKRWFASATESRSRTVNILGKNIPFSYKLLFRDVNSELIIGTDICEDLWVPIPPSSLHCVKGGANLILNLSASNNTVTKAAYRKNLVSMQAAKCYCGYVYVSAGPSESSSDVVFSGHILISENGSIIAESEYETVNVSSVIDIEKLQNDRVKYNSFSYDMFSDDYEPIYVDVSTDVLEVVPFVNAYPFVPSSKNARIERCNEIVKIQARGLATRLEKTGIEKAVIGISGGLDSTLALLIIREAFDMLNIPMKNIIGITMPGFGTSSRTLNNSVDLMKEIGTTVKNISIVPACVQHLKDIEHAEDVFDITYENTQARERTQILFDVANKENGLVIGTGDLSELALGWCTYNGDHMSNYAVNVSIPKTLVKFLIQTLADKYREDGKGTLTKILYDIIDTPISPELLPLNENGEIAQKTESSIGKYDLHDFFLYHYIRNGFDDNKILKLAYIAFPNISKEEITNTFETFTKRFTTQQFKRNCLPDGPKVGSVSLSPRGDWRMPSDIIYRKK